MTEHSNIRKLLCDQNLGLLPHIDRWLKDIQTQLGDKQENFRLDAYDLEFGECQTHVTPNDVKPIVTQLVSMRFPLIGPIKDKFKLLMLAAEFQNSLDAGIIDWSTRERSQYDNKPLRRPISTITGKLDCESLGEPTNSCRITIYRDFELTYAASF
ncbi:hypothetical protein H6S82_29235 [Planktothrix sp. FACHB-1355]|uniref:Uncharacterized protein n=1 Tax=Aerosakkonema funiforme FACHB-1375 TaxID=2949571 RepID=A0A926VIK4_9CYAN|nr:MULTISPECIES: hypothetical protein [Oscillatoriales]MBD2183179.1 hypothetical protein [Aerosakkonema funiforme FACHB-1375]MBD3562896.1 hypothetical protein [Planktothrix sp. FACHB-1355]